MAAPIRTCLGCRRRREQGEFIRFTAVGGKLELTLNSNRTGRGAYVCPDPTCIDAALKGKRLSHVLRTPLTEAAAQELKLELICQLR